MTHNSSSRVVVIIVVMTILALASMACNVTPGDGQVSDAVTDANSLIKDVATEVKETVEATGEGLEVEEQGTVILDAVWDVAKDIAEGD